MLFLAGAVVAMNLSKIYRGTETDGLQQFQFRSFGDTDPAAMDTETITTGSSFTPSAQTLPAAAESAGASAKEIEEAYARGRREALSDAEQHLESAAQGLIAALEEVNRLRTALANNSKQDMLRLVMTIAEQVIRREVSADPNVIHSIIENALQSSVRADHYRVLINPVDLEKVTEKKPFFLASISGLENLTIEGDSSISPGGCRVDSELGTVDATIETQLESIQNALSQAITDAG